MPHHYAAERRVTRKCHSTRRHSGAVIVSILLCFWLSFCHWSANFIHVWDSLLRSSSPGLSVRQETSQWAAPCSFHSPICLEHTPSPWRNSHHVAMAAAPVCFLTLSKIGSDRSLQHSSHMCQWVWSSAVISHTHGHYGAVSVSVWREKSINMKSGWLEERASASRV